MNDQDDYKWKVRVSCLTYNHSKYILDTMNGFCIQKTNFPYVCTIVDDASTDGEPDVIKRYLEEHFNLNDQNVTRNEENNDYYFIFAQNIINPNCYFAVYFLKYNHYQIKKPKYQYQKEFRDYAKYFATCEGDDYWIDSNKLQYQSDFLDAHPDYGLVFTKAKTLIQDTDSFGKVFGKNTCDFYSLLFDNGIPTLTVLYRKKSLEGYNDFIKDEKWPLGDKPVWLYISMHYKLHFENRVSAVYRVLKNSAMSRFSYEARSNFYKSSYDISVFFAERVCPELLPDLLNIINITQLKVAYNYREYDKVLYFYKKIINPDIKVRSKYYLSLLKRNFQ